VQHDAGEAAAAVPDRVLGVRGNSPGNEGFLFSSEEGVVVMALRPLHGDVVRRQEQQGVGAWLTAKDRRQSGRLGVFGLGQIRSLEVGFGNGAIVRFIDGGCSSVTRIWGRKRGSGG
jgi:hypothetical protein